jgi:hypothetical protein
LPKEPPIIDLIRAAVVGCKVAVVLPGMGFRNGINEDVKSFSAFCYNINTVEPCDYGASV